jgi:Domain of unknown function (DUF4365)/Phage integrase family
MLFKRLEKRSGIDSKKVGAHQWRRYMAMTQLAMGHSPLDVQRQMGHTTLTMTNHYASLIFTNGAATHYSFFVQAKATDHIDRYIDKEGTCLNFPIDVDHLKYWEQFWEPVILTVWDSVSDITYWEIGQDYFESSDVDISRKKLSVNISRTNILDDKGLKRIQEETISRFQRFELLIPA